MSKRLVLIIAILLVEATCLFVGVLAAGYGMRRSLANTATQQALDTNRMIAEQFGRLIDQTGLTETARTSQDWNKLQEIIEQAKLPNDGFVCVTDSKTGRLICHPEILVNPLLETMTPGQQRLVNESSDDSIVEQVTPGKTATGTVSLGDGVHVIAAQRLSNLDANLMVHQRMSAIEKSAKDDSAPIYDIGQPVIGLILALSGIGTMLLLTYYDRSLEKANANLECTLVKRTKALTKTRNAIIFGLAKLAENRDTDTGEHLDRIREYSILLAKKLQSTGHKISDRFVADIGLASALHDIGKVGIPDAVLLKPGRLDEEERAIIEKHPIIGCKCLISIEKHLGDDKFLEMATEICLTHHERWDGTGYPLKLQGAKIPLSSRIVAVADVYDALTSRRPYKDPMPHNEAHAIIMNGSGSHFDPEIVAVFDALYNEFKSIREEYIDTVEKLSISGVLDVAAENVELAAL